MYHKHCLNERNKIYNPKEIGDVTEVETMLAFLKCGCNILTPYGDREKYDFVADIGGKLYKIQSKASSLHNGSIQIDCRRSDHKKYLPGEIDFFVTSYNGETYMIPARDCRRGKSLRINPEVSGRGRGVIWAKDYEIGEVVRTLANGG